MYYVEEGDTAVVTSKEEQDDLRTASVRILLVDDFKDFRKLAASIFEQQPRFEVVGEAIDGQDAVQKAEDLKPDLVVLDIGLPKLHGIEAARQIRALSPNSKILFFTTNECPQIVLEAFNVGADGYVIKLDAAGQFLAAVDSVLQGKRYLSRLAGLALCNANED